MANLNNYSLTDKQLEVLIMRNDGMSIKEIAKELNCPTQTIEKRLKVARVKILCMKETLQFLEENGISY